MLPVASREKIALISAAIMQGYILAVSLEIVQTWLFSSGSAPWSAALRTCPTNSIIPRCFSKCVQIMHLAFAVSHFYRLKRLLFLLQNQLKRFKCICRTNNDRTNIHCPRMSFLQCLNQRGKHIGCINKSIQIFPPIRTQRVFGNVCRAKRSFNNTYSIHILNKAI